MVCTPVIPNTWVTMVVGRWGVNSSLSLYSENLPQGRGESRRVYICLGAGMGAEEFTPASEWVGSRRVHPLLHL